MQDPELQAATASEPLSIDQEYAMQQSWRTDHDKLTFIVCLPIELPLDAYKISAALYDGPDRMIGDINLFLFELNDEQENKQNASQTQALIGEIELMIARKTQRGKGFGRTAILMFIEYVILAWTQISQEYSQGASNIASTSCSLAYLRVRVNHTNEASLRLFQSLGFKALSEEPNYFGEIEMRFSSDEKDFMLYRALQRHRILQYS